MSVSSARRVLLVSSNGTGMGHLTRLVAMGRRAQDAEVRVLSMSQAVGQAVAGRLDFEYLPSAGDLGIGSRRWSRIFERRAAAAVARFGPDVVVFDGAYPYPGLLRSRSAHPSVRMVWSRRAMWKPGLGAAQLHESAGFDLVLEPGDVAAAADRGLTAARTDAVRVRPVVLLDDDELLERDVARAELGLDLDRPAVLVSLGAGNLADIGGELGAVVGALTAVPDLQVCVTRPAIAGDLGPSIDGVHVVSRYPVTRWSRAFDAAVTTAGYNSFHESVAFALPSAFVANTTQLDDQLARARWAQEQGAGLHLEPQSAPSLAQAVDRLVDPVWRAQVARRCRALWPGNGAAEAMAAVLGVVR